MFTHARIIYHDALSSWWSKGAQQYLKDKGFEFRQVKSLASTNDLNRYKGKLVGDSPEMMPLDNNLFSDFAKALVNNVCATRHLPSTSPEKFSIASPNPTFEAMERTWQYFPTPERIAEDILRWPSSLQEVYTYTFTPTFITRHIPF